MKSKILFSVLFSLCIISLSKGQSNGDTTIQGQQKEIDSEQLLKWAMWGQGEVFKVGEQICLKESSETKGAMLVSPLTYEGDVVLKFDVLALTPASVIAVVISGSNKGGSSELSIPENYDGNFSFWSEEKDNYFFAFKNAPHGLTPFVSKNSTQGEILASATDNIMVAGLYYQIEIGRINNKLWLSIDNEKLFEVEDDRALSGGHVALRIRGTVGFKGACLIKNFRIAAE